MMDVAAAFRPRSSTRRGGMWNEWLRVRITEQGNLCGLCGRPMGLFTMPQSNDPNRPSLDHIKPRSRGGWDRFENTQAVHKRCNELKGSAESV